MQDVEVDGGLGDRIEGDGGLGSGVVGFERRLEVGQRVEIPLDGRTASRAVELVAERHKRRLESTDRGTERRGIAGGVSVACSTRTLAEFAGGFGDCGMVFDEPLGGRLEQSGGRR